MKKLIPLLFAFAGALSAANTAIVDTIRYSNNSLATCTFSIYGPISTAGVGIATTAGDGSSVTPSTYTYNVVAGVLSVSLHPNDDLTPAGTTYRVTRACRPPGPASVTEYWSVPTSGSPLTVAGVSVSTGSVPTLAYGQIRGLTLGDLLYGASSGLAARLPKPSDGTYNLTFTSGIPGYAAISSGLPSMTGNSGKTLTTDGSSASWSLPASLLASADIIGLFTSCTGTKVLSADGACHATTGGVWGSITGTLSDQTDLNSALAGKAASSASTTVNGQACALGSTCTVADSTKVPTTRTVNSHALSADVTVSKSDVGLGNADNTSDANKPVSTAAQTALDLKANLASPTFTGTPALPSGTTATTQSQADASTKLATTAYVDTGLSGKASTALNSGKVSKLRKSDDSGDALTCDASGTCSIGATVLKTGGPGVINVRLQYGAVPDGSTDNSTAITNAFTNANAFTNGTPTVYFDCNTNGQTVCEYNYGGSGISPINPLVAMVVQCAPGVSLNYTGSAHAVDAGPTNLSQPDAKPYLIQGCTWTGGASYTQGIVFNNYVVAPQVVGNTFLNFGNRTGYSIYLAGANNWEPLVDRNHWWDSDGFSRNIFDGHNANADGLRVTNNAVDCEASNGGACSISTIGVGFWVSYGATMFGNILQFHQPLIRISAAHGGSQVKIFGNHFEEYSAITGPVISYGDPGGTATNITGITLDDNLWFSNSAANIPYIGPETPASSSYALLNTNITNQKFATTPSGTAKYVNTNGGAGCYASGNRDASSNLLARAHSPTLFDNDGFHYFAPVLTTNNNVNPPTASTVAVFTSNALNLSWGSFHTIAAPMICSDVSGSGTVQVCATTPEFSASNTYFAPAAGDAIIYKTTTTNTGDVTINVNEQGAIHIRKLQAKAVLAAGDLQSGVYHLLVYDGTYWEMLSPSLIAPTSCTGLPTGTAYNNSGTAGFCP
jgi:hypothetical protein